MTYLCTFRSDKLNPNQGGKYVGFGSGPGPVVQKQEDPMALLVGGFGRLTSAASSVASAAVGSASRVGGVSHACVLCCAVLWATHPSWAG